MDLTPIKVRGRKRKPTALYHSKVSTPSSSQEASTPKAKRRRKDRLAELKRRSKPAMPTLQGLPQELLEMIFLHSMNPALPRACPAIGRNLSSRAVTMEFTMRSFFHTVDHKANIRDRKITSDPRLQSDVLSCRFFTWDFFLAYVQKAHDALVTLRGKAWEKTGVGVPGPAEFDNLWPFRFTKIPYLSLAVGFYIPEKLLHGPWTDDKASLLYVLVALSGEIDWRGSMAGETAKSGIKEAIKGNNERAVAALAVLLGIPKAITTDILRYAILDCGGPIQILRHLLFNAQILAEETDSDSLDFYDPKIWAWLNDHGAHGKTIKTMLERADAFDLDFYFEDDVDWTAIVGFPYGASKFDVRTRFNRVVRELLTNLYRNFGRKITRRRMAASQS